MKMLLVTDSCFPYGAALSSRLRCFCALFSELGYDVHVIALSSPGELQPGVVTKGENCTYETVKRGSKSSIDTFRPDLQLIKTVKKRIEEEKTDLIFMTSCPMYFGRIARIARKKGIPLYVEQCEWLDLSNYKFGKFDPRYRRADKLRAGGYRKANGIVSISRLLDEHYKKLGVPSIRIPTILDVRGNKLPARSPDREKITVVYTGSPGVSKEYLRPAIENLAENARFRGRITFHIFGPAKKTVLANIGGDEALLKTAGESVVLHGKAPQKEIAGILANADYQLFVRPDRRSSNAGFPTKLGESMAVGTPVVANDTGDIALYLKDGENGFLLDGNTAESVRKAFEKMLAQSGEEYEAMRRSARTTAEEAFDFRTYLETVRDFIAHTGSGK